MKAAKKVEVIEKITGPMIQKIYAVGINQLGMDKETLHEYIFKLTGSEHISDLSKKEGIMVIERMVEIADGGKQSARGMATKAQLWKIHDLEKELGWSDNPNRLKAFMKKYSGIDNEKWLKFPGASKVIEAMKKLLEKQSEEAAAELI